jgi:hypothetical protein
MLIWTSIDAVIDTHKRLPVSTEDAHQPAIWDTPLLVAD